MWRYYDPKIAHKWQHECPGVIKFLQMMLSSKMIKGRHTYRKAVSILTDILWLKTGLGSQIGWSLLRGSRKSLPYPHLIATGTIQGGLSSSGSLLLVNIHNYFPAFLKTENKKSVDANCWIDASLTLFRLKGTPHPSAYSIDCFIWPQLLIKTTE